MDKKLFEMLDIELQKIGLEDPIKHIVDEIKRLWMPFNSMWL